MYQLIRKFSLTALLCCLFSFSAAAAIDLGEIELGKTYNIPDFASVTATFTAPSTGTLIQDGVPDIEIPGLSKTWAGYGSNGQIYTYEVKEGTTYTLQSEFVMSGGKVSWIMEGSTALTTTEILPAAGSALSLTTNYTGEVIISFNMPVVASGAKLVTGEHSIDATIAEQGGISLVIGIRQALQSLYDSGAISKSGGDNISLVVTGIATTSGTVYGNDGTLTVGYTTAGKPLSLISTNCKNDRALKSFYTPDDPEAKLTFTFDNNVADDGRTYIAISCGNQEIDGGYYYESLPVTVSGATVTADLSGRLRNLNDYLAVTDLKFVGVQLCNVRDTFGNIAGGDGDASVGSYSFSFTYDYIERVAVSSEFTPASGSSLQGVDEIEIWFNNADKLMYDGVRFECPDVTVVVPLDQLQVTADGNDRTILVNVPAEIKDKSNVTVTLNNLMSLDGYDHAAEIRALYDQFVATLVSPIRDGGEYATTGTDDFVFVLNETFGYMRYDLYNGEEWVYGSWLNDAGDGTYTAYNGNWPLYRNVDNYMLIRCYADEGEYWNGGDVLASYEFHFTGLTAPFTYSDVKFVGIDPEPDTTIEPAEGFCFTLTFDGLVRIGDNSCINTGFGSSAPFAKVEAVDPEELSDLSSVWRLYPPTSLLDGTGIDISVYAYDIEDKLVEGNMGGGETDFLQFSYVIRSQSNLLTITITPADGTTVNALDVVTVSADGKPVSRNYNYTGAMPCVFNDWFERVYVFGDDDINGIVNEADPEGAITEMQMSLQTPVAQEGVYILWIPEGFFILGDQFDTYNNEEVWTTIRVSGGDSITGIHADTDGNYDVYGIDGRHVMRTTDAEALRALRPGIYIINGGKVLIR